MRAWVLVVAAAVLVAGVVVWKRAGSRPAKDGAAAVDEDGQPGAPGEQEGRRGPRPGGARAPGSAPSSRERLWPAPFAATATPPPTGLPAPRYEPDAAAIATTERDHQVEAIRATGPESGALLKAVEALSSKWETLSAGGSSNVHVGKWDCYKAGCFVDVLQRTDQTYEDLSSRILDSQELAAWSGQKTRSAPIRKADGSVEVTWMLLVAPDAGQPGATAP